MMHRLDAIADQELRETLLYARAQPLPVTADEVASAQQIHRNVARGRLERLADAGLLIRSFERRTGRTGPGAGRPAKTYRVAPELSAIEFPERRYEQLIGLVVDALPERGRRDGLREIGRAFGRAFAGTAVDEIGCDTPNCQRDDADCRVLLTLRNRRASRHSHA